MQHVVEFLEAHFGDVEFVDPSQRQEAGNALEETRAENEMDVETKSEAVDAKTEAFGMEEEALDVKNDGNIQEEELKDIEMGDEGGEVTTDDERENKPLRRTNVPTGPYLLVKVDKYEACITIPEMVRI